MTPGDIPFKTSQGIDEVRTRARKLPQRLRTVLILVDGASTLGELQIAAQRMGAPADALQSLLELGLVEIGPPLLTISTSPSHWRRTWSSAAVTPATSQAKNMLDNIGGGIGRLPTAEHRKQIIEFVDALPQLPGR